MKTLDASGSRLFSNKTVLVVDDEAELAELIELEFSLQGGSARHASSVGEALGALSRERFDLVLSDMKMPGRSGTELVSAIRRSHYCHPPVILMSGYSQISTIDAMEMGIRQVLHKPFKRSELLAAAGLGMGPIQVIEDKDKLPTLIEEDGKKCSLRLGHGGFSLNLAANFRQGEKLTFLLKADSFELSGSGRVEWLAGNAYGVSILALSRESKTNYEAYLKVEEPISFIPGPASSE